MATRKQRWWLAYRTNDASRNGGVGLGVESKHDARVNDTNDGFAGAKLPLASTWMNWIISGNSKKNIPAHQNLPVFSPPSGQLEDMALVLYGPDASASWTAQYYIPVCPPPGVITAKGNTWSC